MARSTQPAIDRIAVAVGAAALAASGVAVVRYRATGISGARFDHALADGVKDQVTYYNAGPWIAHFEVWAGAAVALALCAALVAALGRFSQATH